MPPAAATGLSFSLAGVSCSFSFVLAEATAVVLLEAAAASPADGLGLKKEVIILYRAGLASSGRRRERARRGEQVAGPGDLQE